MDSWGDRETSMANEGAARSDLSPPILPDRMTVSYSSADYPDQPHGGPEMPLTYRTLKKGKPVEYRDAIRARELVGARSQHQLRNQPRYADSESARGHDRSIDYLKAAMGKHSEDEVLYHITFHTDTQALGFGERRPSVCRSRTQTRRGRVRRRSNPGLQGQGEPRRRNFRRGFTVARRSDDETVEPSDFSFPPIGRHSAGCTASQIAGVQATNEDCR